MIKKYLLLLAILHTLLLAESSFFDTIYDKAKDLSEKGWEQTKKYTNLGKNFTIEQTIIQTANLSLDTKNIKVIDAKISDNNEHLYLEIFLNGEQRDFQVDISHYQWSIYTKNQNKYIVIKDLEFYTNIPWLEHILKYYIQTQNGFLVLEYSQVLEGILLSMKDSTKCKENILPQISLQWANHKKEFMQLLQSSQSLQEKLNTILKTMFNDSSLQFTKLEINNIGNISIHAKLNDNEPFYMTLKDFKWATANKKTLLVLRDIELETNKKWIQSLLESQDNEIIFGYDAVFHKILKPLRKRI